MAVKFEPRSSIAGDLTQALSYFKLSNAVVVTMGDALTIVNGFVERLDKAQAGVNQYLLGVAAETLTGTSASAEIGVYCDPNLLYYSDADGDLATADIGKIYCVTTGANRIDQSTAKAATTNTTFPFILVKTDPDGDNDASKGLFKPYHTLLGSTGGQ